MELKTTIDLTREEALAIISLRLKDLDALNDDQLAALVEMTQGDAHEYRIVNGEHDLALEGEIG